MSINSWKRQVIDGMAAVFSGKAEVEVVGREAQVDRLHAKIGELVVERDYCGKPPDDERRPEAPDGRARTPAAVDRAAMPAPFD